VIPYVITTKTGDKRGSGTDANVFIQIYGVDGKSEEYPLRNKSDNFERGKVNKKISNFFPYFIFNTDKLNLLKEDVFKIEADDVGPIFKVRIGHDNKGLNSGMKFYNFKSINKILIYLFFLKDGFWKKCIFNDSIVKIK